jgi:dihydropteroate synthase
VSLAAVPGTGPNTTPIPVLRLRPREQAWAELPKDRTLVMGVLNVTEDSFSDGGQFLSTDDAIAHGLELMKAGADIIDVGGESTRPDADFVPEDVEAKRVVPVVQALVAAGAVVSVDTTHVSTARACIAVGAHLINDVAGLTHEPGMPQLIAETGIPYVLMHRRGDQQTMGSKAHYENTVEEVTRELLALRDEYVEAGVKAEQIILDPGIGFAKNAPHNWEILAATEHFAGLGHKVLIGTSRKRFLGHLLDDAGLPHEPTDRDHATAATSALAAQAGAWCVRVHDVVPSRDAVRVAAEKTHTQT